jgi:hypothetical protein
MHLTELAYITGAEIDITYSHETRKFSARLKGAEVVEGQHGGVLASVRGHGRTPEIAQRDYAKRIAGQRIRLGGLGGVDYNVPKSLSF